MKSNFKKAKLQEKIQQCISSYLKTMSDSRFSFVSITRVELSDDKSRANIFWDVFDPSKRTELSEALNNVSGKVRSQLSLALKIRHVPAINFIYDSQYDDEKNIMDILKQEQEAGKR